MNLRTLVGRKIRVVVSEPWSFSPTSFLATLEKVEIKDGGQSRVLVRSEHPLVFENRVYSYLVASPRQFVRPLDGLSEGNQVECNLTHITEEHAASENSTDTSGWRGGLALIGTVSLVK